MAKKTWSFIANSTLLVIAVCIVLMCASFMINLGPIGILVSLAIGGAILLRSKE